jgi:hypothetical protein
LLGDLYGLAKEAFHSMKVVECIGRPETTCYASNNVKIKIQIYQLYDTREEDETLPQAEITSMPHIDFDGQWDQ